MIHFKLTGFAILVVLILQSCSGVGRTARRAEIDPGAIRYGGTILPYDVKVKTYKKVKYYYQGKLVFYVDKRGASAMTLQFSSDLIGKRK